MTQDVLGQTLSVSAGLLWAAATIMFRKSGLSVPPLSLNLFKNVLVLPLFLLSFPLTGQSFFIDRPGGDYVLLIVSGVIGIGVADAVYFKSLNILGAGFSAIVDCMYSPSIIAFGFLLLGDRLSGLHLAGAAMIVGSVALTATERHDQVPKNPMALASGIGLGILSMALMALSIVIVKPVLNETPVLWATTVRLLGGIGFLVLFGALLPGRRGMFGCFRPHPIWKISIPASIVGTYLSLLAWIGGMKFTQVGPAATLNQLSTVFTVLLAAAFLNERLTPRRLAASMIAFAGAVAVILS